MASTRNFPCSADTLVAQSGSSEMGAGKDDHLPIGLWGSYLFRSYLKFTPDWSGMTKIVSAQLHLRTSNQYHIGFGSSPRVIIDAVASSGGNFVENSSVGSCNGGSWGTGSTNWGNQPAVTAADSVSPAITTTESAWVSLDLTEMVKYWAPAAAGGGAGPNYGLRIRSYDETSQSRTTEFYSREQGTNDPYISVTYESNNAPATPTTTAPASAARQGPPAAG